MRIILRPVCWIKGYWRTFNYFMEAGFDFIAPISGHDYVSMDKFDIVLKCEVCNKFD